MGYCEIRQRVCCVLFARCILNRRSRHVVLRTEEERRQSRQDRILTKRFSDPLTIWDVSSSSVQDRNSLKARLWGSLRFKIPAYDEAKTNLSVPKQLQLSIDEQMRGIYGDPLGSIKYDTRPHFWDKTRVSSKSLRRDERNQLWRFIAQIACGVLCREYIPAPGLPATANAHTDAYVGRRCAACPGPPPNPPSGCCQVIILSITLQKFTSSTPETQKKTR